MMDYQSRKGSTSVFLTLILAAMLMLAGLFIYHSSQAAARSYVDAVFELAGRSVLSEYDTVLLKEYGLFAIHADETEIENKIKFYTNCSFHRSRIKGVIREKKSIDPLKLQLDAVNVSLSGYSITNIDLFEEQIQAYMKYGLAENIANKKYNNGRGTQDAGIPANPEQANIMLKNEQVVHSLPSQGYPGIDLDIKQLFQTGIPSPQEIKTYGKSRFFINEYILNQFLNNQKGLDTRATFFLNEAEYILSGGLNDEHNYKKVRNHLVLLRTMLNLPCIYTDPEKLRAVEALASMLTPGPEAVITQLLIATGWAAAEAENDMKRLENSEKVALFKSKSNWALNLSLNLDLEGFMNGKNHTDIVEPQNTGGINYEDYLRILLYLQDREIQLLRCMDLIQLNMKTNYYRDFDFREYYGGFQFEAMVQGRSYSYIQKY